MKIIFSMLFVIPHLLFISGSDSVSANELSGPDGKTTYTLSCSGTGKDWSDCYQEADILCPDGYNIIKRSTGTVSVPVYGKYTLVPSKKLIIECK